MDTVQFQSYVFSYTVYGGILIGILYDIYRLLKGKRKNERLITSLWDVLFLLSTLFVVLWAVFSSNYGDIRAYVLIGFLVGFYLYEKLLGRIITGLLYLFFRSIRSFIKGTDSILALPIKLLCSFIFRCYNSLARIIRKEKALLRKAGRLSKQIIDDTRKYNNLIAKRKRKSST